MSSHQGHGVHFFKVILESTLQKGELKVPKSFQKKHWPGIANPVFLRLPNSTEWKVYWFIRDGDVLFKNGWHDFAKYSCLGVSHFVVFRYEGNSRFNVIVFDKSALEIKYPSNRGTSEEVEEIDENECRIVEECSPLEIKRPTFPSSSSHTRKRMKISRKEEDDDEINHEMKKSGDSERYIKLIHKTFHGKVKKRFRSENEHFTCSIQKSYTERDLMIIPTSFSKLHLHREGDTATLFINKAYWDVELKINSRGSLTFATGWKEFLMNNNLKIGDVCAFELHKLNPISFKVTIFPFEEDSNTPLFKGQAGAGPSLTPYIPNKTPVTAKANGTWQNNKDLQMCIKPPYRLATIPFTYIKGLLKESGYVTFLFEKNEWKVKVLYYERNSFARFSLGWAEFVKGCGMEEGDVCNFKLIDAKNHLFEVSSISKRNIVKLE